VRTSRRVPWVRSNPDLSVRIEARIAGKHDSSACYRWVHSRVDLTGVGYLVRAMDVTSTEYRSQWSIGWGFAMVSPALGWVSRTQRSGYGIWFTLHDPEPLDPRSVDPSPLSRERSTLHRHESRGTRTYGGERWPGNQAGTRKRGPTVRPLEEEKGPQRGAGRESRPDVRNSRTETR